MSKAISNKLGEAKPTNLACQGHAPADNQIVLLDVGRHHAELAALDEFDQAGNFILERRLFLVLGDIRVGVLRTSVGIAESRRHLCGRRADGTLF